MERVRRKFGMLFQGGALLNSLTVGENIALPIRHHTDLPDETIEIMVKMKLELVGLRDAEHLKPSSPWSRWLPPLCWLSWRMACLRRS